MTEKKNNRRTFSSHMTKVWGMNRSSFSHEARGESGKMLVICLSESAEVLMRGLEYSITRAAAEMVRRSQALTQLQPPPPPYSLCITLFLSVSLFRFCAVFSHSLTHTSIFLGLSPLCLTILLSRWLSQSLQSSVSVLLHFPSNSTSILPLSVILKLLSSLYASTIHHCFYAGPDSAYITLDTRPSSLYTH